MPYTGSVIKAGTKVSAYRGKYSANNANNNYLSRPAYPLEIRLKKQQLI